MGVSTLIEVAGFVCLVIAAFLVHVIAGFVTAGLALILVGYCTDDAAAAVAVSRIVDPVRLSWRLWRARGVTDVVAA